MLNEVAVPDLPVVSHVRVPYKDTALNMGFVDVGLRDGPVVVVLHGAPGGVEHFAELYGPLVDKGIRVVAPEFPGYGRTTIEDAAAYDESTEARATLVHNFLTTVGISSVAAVGGHSMGVAAAVHLAANYDYFKSLVYLSGIGLKPHRGIWPYWAVGLVARLLNNVVTEPLTQRFLSTVYSMKGFSPDAVKTGGGLKAGIVSASRIGFDTLEANMSCVRDKGLPVFFAFTQNDRLVEWSLAMEVVKYFRTPEESISWLDGNEELTNGARFDDVSVPFPWVMIFERGGHFVHRSHQALVNQRLVSFVEQVLARVGAKS